MEITAGKRLIVSIPLIIKFKAVSRFHLFEMISLIPGLNILHCNILSILLCRIQTDLIRFKDRIVKLYHNTPCTHIFQRN